MPARPSTTSTSPSERSLDLSERAHRAIPAGCHTYSKGDDQFPELAPALLARAEGCRTWDVDGNEFLDWGMGLRSVILGHAYPRVVDAAVRQIGAGTNLTRPSPVELELAEQLVDLIPCAEMVKFAKNGSDVTTAAIRLARAATGRDLVAFPREHPFYSVDDWFIGTTAMDAGVPQAIKELSLTFSYNDLGSLEELFARHPGRIAAVITEAATDVAPEPGFLEGVRELTRAHGAVLVFDEMITGFRWHASGAQAYFGVTPDLATFGKAIGNGFSVSVLAGSRELMSLGGLDHDQARVFLLSTTHGGETHSLAAAQATISEMVERDVVPHVWEIGGRLQEGLNRAARSLELHEVVACVGYPCSPGLVFRGPQSAGLHTLFQQELIARGVLMPYIAPSFSHRAGDVDRTVEAAREALELVARVAGGEPLGAHLTGRPTRPVFRRLNDVTADSIV